MVRLRTFLHPLVLAAVAFVPLSHGDGDLQLPALYELDEWTECSQLYCMARVIVSSKGKPGSSAAFDPINDLQRFRRTLLDRGVCLFSVDTISERKSDGERHFPAQAWNRTDRYILEREHFPSHFHANESTLLAASVVIDRQLAAQHPGLAAYTEIEYCLEKRSVEDFDHAVSISLALVLVVGCVTSWQACSWIFRELRSPRTNVGHKPFLLFDLYKNFAMVGSVVAHCVLFGPFLMPLKNIDFLEQIMAHPNAKMYRLLCPFLMLVFFTMSSMLLTVKLLQDRTANRSQSTRPTTFAAIVAHRLIRLQPLNLLTVGFCAFAYDRFIGGPLAPRQLIFEQGACRSRWWMNVLFISNFNMHKPCLPHSWYISADFQLFLLIALLLFAVFSLHEMRFFLMDSAYLAQLYTPFYNNLSWSVGGMVAGFVYDHYQRCASQTSLATIRHRVNLFIAVAFLPLLAFGRLTLAASEGSAGDERLWLATCYAAFKLSAAAFFSAGILRILLTEKDFPGSAIVRIGAKLYYCVYLIHMPVFRIVFSRATNTVEVTPELLVDEYDLMPPLFHYENVTNCFERYSNSLYCVVKTVVQPNDSSEIWRTIEKVSKLPSYHEHSQLDRGMCVESCVRLVNGLDPETASLLATDPIKVNPYHLLSIPSENTSLSQYQQRYGKILNICVNYHLRERYNMIGYSELERCVTAETFRPALDVYHVAFLMIMLVLMTLVIYATFFDWKNSSNSSEKSEDVRQTGSMWLEFSLRRSWSQLIAKPRTILQRDFAFVEIFRLLSVFLIIALHSMMMFAAASTKNIRPMEEFFDQTLMRIATSIFPFQVHTFFTISGVMLAVYFLDQASSAKARIGWSFYGKAIVVRYLRVFPALFILWLFQASWMDRLSEGPGDYRLVELEKDNCRTNGWLNFLLLNNYFRYRNMCLQQSWHLAVDFHYCLIGVPFLLLIHRHPRLTKPLIFGAVAFSIGAPIVNLYRWKLPGVILVSFKHVRFLNYILPDNEYDYVVSHAHICSYFSGIFAGMAYHRFRNGGFPEALSGGKTFRYLRWFPLAMVLLQASAAPLFYHLDYSEPLLWNAIFGALHRCCWGAMCAIGILHGATVWRARHARIHFHPVLLVLSRLSFGVFMVQFSVLRSLARNASGEGIDFSWKIGLITLACTWVGSYTAALFLALFVELPFASVFQHAFEPKRFISVENDKKLT
ncbi:hypothetical protein ZHAS_00016569 [Anopheles sinensis]|uniref:Acyltransferase 3 domain-containing protein n=1 Tax=Anopheles sinensis TaxID=74873 RepID=A0A084WED9_ANOSI|nr:hypothetical protein ZHAS_00016569 [Anopheles sinensis]